MRLVVGAGVFLLLFGPLYPAAYFGPHYWAQLKMEEVAQVTVLAWRDKSEVKARDGVSFEMNDRDVPDYIGVEDCEFVTEGEVKEVTCAWDIVVNHPLSSEGTELNFFVGRGVDSSGSLYSI